MTTPGSPHPGIATTGAAPTTLATERLQRGTRGDVVLLHGILGSRRNWRTFGKRLADARPDLGVVTVDLRNHGDSHGMAPPHDLRTCALDLWELCGGELEPRVLVGHSYGGKVVLEALAMAESGATGAGPLPAQAWVLDAAPGAASDDAGSTAAAARDVFGVMDALATLPMPLPTRQALVAGLEAQGLGPGLVQWMTTNLRNAAAGGYELRFDLEAARAMMQSYLRTDHWPVLERPPAGVALHFVRGGRSERWTQTDIGRLLRISEGFGPGGERGARLHTLDQAGHWLHADDPDGLLRVLVNGLGEGAMAPMGAEP